MKTGTERIAEERQRQIDQEGWTAEHDDKHANGEMAGAAAAYVLGAAGFLNPEQIEGDHRLVGYSIKVWPWGKEWWKPGTPLRDLVKAGALIAAEIDRLTRAGMDGLCRVCGCTDDNCRQCIEATGKPCSWAEPRLCSRCADELGEVVDTCESCGRNIRVKEEYVRFEDATTCADCSPSPAELQDAIAEQMVPVMLDWMDADNGCRHFKCTFNTEENQAKILPLVKAMLAQGWKPLEDDIEEMICGEHTEIAERFGAVPGYAELDKALNEIFDAGSKEKGK